MTSPSHRTTPSKSFTSSAAANAVRVWSRPMEPPRPAPPGSPWAGRPGSFSPLMRDRNRPGPGVRETPLQSSAKILLRFSAAICSPDLDLNPPSRPPWCSFEMLSRASGRTGSGPLHHRRRNTWHTRPRFASARVLRCTSAIKAACKRRPPSSCSRVGVKGRAGRHQPCPHRVEDQTSCLNLCSIDGMCASSRLQDVRLSCGSIRSRSSRSPRRRAAQLRSDRYGGIHLHGIAVEQIWLVRPLPHCVHRCLTQHRRAGNELQILNRAIRHNDGMATTVPWTCASLASAGKSALLHG